jgi:tetratricopeptide (TPR) repeat protein
MKHVPEFTLLLLRAGELSATESQTTSAHLATCRSCLDTFESIADLDSELRGLARSGELAPCLATHDFDPKDPFRVRPPLRNRRRAVRLALGIRAAEIGLEGSERMLKTLEDSALPAEALRDLRLDTGEDRYTLFYVLQKSGHKIAEDPRRSLSLARAVLELPTPPESGDAGQAEGLLSWSALQAQAHSLAAQASLWLREYVAAQAHLMAAYRAFAFEGDETAIATVELVESQRRVFVGDGRGALSLARRARATLDGRGLDDLAARAAVIEGLALATLGKFEEAIAAYRGALPTFERLGLWSNYVGALNSLATSLYRTGRLDEARREFARAFRRFSREEHRSWLGYLRHGLGDILFAAGRYKEAAISFGRASQVFAECGLRASALSAVVVEAESWAHYGNVARASARIASVAAEVEQSTGLDPSVRGAISKALARIEPDSDSAATFQTQLRSLLASS